MARPNPNKNTRACEPGRSWTRRSCGAIPAAACAFILVFLFCLGSAPGWAQKDDQQPQPKDPGQQQKTPPQQTQQNQKKSEPSQPKNQPQQKVSPSSSPSDPQQRQKTDQQQMRGLDEQIQEIKSDVLGISADLRQLEEKLLYPSGTQVAVFVALAKGDTMRLDAVRLQIDGQLVAHYIYSAKELEALHKGGVQKLYVGNVAAGEHQIEVLVDGKLQSGADFSRTEHFAFRKEVKPKVVGLTLAGSGDAPITLGEW